MNLSAFSIVPAMKRILVVDDDQAICALMADILQAEGWSVTTARNGVDALAKMRANTQDLVLLDLTMPVLDGWAVLAERQADTTLSDVPVLAMSAGGNGGLDRAKALGATDCMPKPFDLDAVLTALESLRRPGPVVQS